MSTAFKTARFKTREHAFSGAWEDMQAVFGLDADMDLGTVTIQAYDANANPVYWADADGAEGAELDPGDAASLEFTGRQIHADSFFVKGTAGQNARMTWLAP